MSRPTPSTSLGVRLVVALYVALVLVVVTASLGWTVTFAPPLRVPAFGSIAEVSIPPSGLVQVPVAVYVYSLLGALAYAFTFLIRKFDCETRALVSNALRIPAALPLAAGVYLFLEFFVGTEPAGSNLGPTIAATSFLTGLYVSLILHGFRTLGDRFYGTSTSISLPGGRSRESVTIGRDAVDDAESPSGTTSDTTATGALTGTRHVREALSARVPRSLREGYANADLGRTGLLFSYLLALAVAVALSAGWPASGRFAVSPLGAGPVVRVVRAVPDSAAFTPVHVPEYVYLFSLLGGLAYVFTFLFRMWRDEEALARLTSRRLLALGVRLPAAVTLGAGMYLVLDSGLLVLMEDSTLVRETMAGAAFLTGLYVQLALKRLERIGYRLARLGNLEFVDVRPRPESAEGEERLVFRNTGGGAVDLDGWEVRVYHGDDETPVGGYAFDPAALDPGDSLVVFTTPADAADRGTAAETAFVQYWPRESSWGAYGTDVRLELVDSAGRAVASKAFTMPGRPAAATA
ncbi:hypothetical protein [Salinirarus marinus]|uniref:hypothetical protein n=1 Tax=Salinirarus marinus TaxID=3068310 RepID=UPI003C6BDB74